MLTITTPAFSTDNASEPRPGEDAWFEEDIDTSQVNVGELVFLREVPSRPIPSISNELSIPDSALNDGWVSLQQCHDGLDPVPAVEVVYRYRSIRDLHIVHTRNIGMAWLDGQSVQMKNVRQAARLCIAAEVRLLQQHKDGTYSLENGPFHRRFLDGYYPLRVNMNINYPESLVLVRLRPEVQPGLSLMQQDNRLSIEALFNGPLHFRIIFRPRQ